MHLFIVNDRTLAVSLKYGFVGTTKPNVVDWSDADRLHPTSETNQAWLYSDICGVHAGDEILYYLERPSNDFSREGGRFFGVFRCVSPAPFWEPSGRYLQSELQIPVCYRLLVEPVAAYSKGLTEWETMDEMTGFTSVQDIPWTLIYRKMLGGRGCTPMLPHEAARIRTLLDRKNGGQALSCRSLGYAGETLCLCPQEGAEYRGNTDVVPDIGPRAKALLNMGTRSAEMHIQAFLMQVIGRDSGLTQRLFPGVRVDWVGNEVYCGAGMQRMDILLFASSPHNTFIHILEIKRWQADGATAAQLNRYVKWVRAHVPGTVAQHVVPTVVCSETTKEFHQEMKVYLRGHGIPAYREVRFDKHLEVAPEIHDV